jgi:hypothetical protein
VTNQNFVEVYKYRFERELKLVKPEKRIQWLKLKKKACLELIKDLQAELNVYGQIK